MIIFFLTCADQQALYCRCCSVESAAGSTNWCSSLIKTQQYYTFLNPLILRKFIMTKHHDSQWQYCNLLFDHIQLYILTFNCKTMNLQFYKWGSELLHLHFYQTWTSVSDFLAQHIQVCANARSFSFMWLNVNSPTHICGSLHSHINLFRLWEVYNGP